MGEYADMALDDAVSGWLEDIDGIGLNDGEWCGWLGPRIRRHNKMCKYCRKPNLIWRTHRKGWRLFETVNNVLQLHSCKEAMMPSVSEMQRLLEEEEAELRKYIPKSDKERILRKIRQLERQLGVTPRDYNGER